MLEVVIRWYQSYERGRDAGALLLRAENRDGVLFGKLSKVESNIS